MSNVEGGWIKLHRKLADSACWRDTNSHTRIVLVTLLMSVNYERKEWLWNGKKYICEPGQVVTSVNKIRQWCGKGMTVGKVRSALKVLEELSFLTTQTTNKNTLISICKWSEYQEEPTNKSQTNRKQLTTTKEREERKEVTRYLPGDEIPQSVKEEVEAKLQVAQGKFDAYHEKVQAWKGADGVKDLKATVMVWMRRDIEKGDLKKELASPAGLGERRRL